MMNGCSQPPLMRPLLSANKAAIRWCAVYTRKSSEEGLEQQFKRLD
jgi:hypothetical protein